MGDSSPNRLRLLGAAGLEGADGREIRPVLVGPKRLALLAYLAVARPHGLHRRDTLLALLWPELDQTRARSALRGTLHVLRRSLGEGAVVTRGVEEVGLDEARVWCDARAFEELLAAGRTSEALALYRGPLLDGFFVTEALEFERWLDLERRRLHDAAAAGAGALAEAEGRAGERSRAVSWARWAATLTPDDESAQRRLMEALAASGDRAGALDVYEELARRLREDYGAAPDPATRALAERVRGEPAPPVPEEFRYATAVRIPPPIPPSPSAGAVSGDTNAFEDGTLTLEAGADVRQEPPAADLQEEPPAAEVQEEFPAADRSGKHQRWPTLVAISLVLLFAAGLAWLARQREPSVATALSPTRVVVLPFTFRGDPEYAYLGNGIVDLLSIGLDGPASMRSVDSQAILGYVGEDAGDDVRPGRARSVATRFGAGHYVVGQVVEAGGRLRIRAALHRAEGGDDPLVQASAEGKASELFDLVDRVAGQLLAGRGDLAGSRLARIAAVTSGSLPALKAYLQGEHALRAGHLGPAVDAFQRAVEADSLFALADYRLSVAALWDRRFKLAREAAERAARHASRLSRGDRLLLEGYRAWWRGAADEAEGLYREVLATHPHDVEALQGLGEVLYHFNPLRGRSRAEARRPFDQSLAFDPGHGESLFHLLELAAWDHSDAVFDTLYARLDLQSEFALEWRALRAVVKDEAAGLDKLEAELSEAGDHAQYRALFKAASFAPDLEAVHALAGRRVRGLRDPAWRARGHLLVAHVALGRGRWSEAREELAAAEVLDPTSALEHRALFQSLSFVPVAPAELLASLRELSGALPAGASEVRGDESLRMILRLYASGLLHARLGEARDVLVVAETLEGMMPAAEDSSLARDLARGLRARATGLLRNHAAAVGVFDSGRLQAPLEIVNRSAFHSRTAELFARAEALREAGRLDEAEPWYAAAADLSFFGLPYRAVAHFRRAEIQELRGEREKAAEGYARVIDLWRACDPEFRPMVEEARRRVASLSRPTVGAR